LAKKLLDKGDVKAARKGFRNLIKKFPRSKNADNAQFWIGESYYREKWYQKAILEYQKVIENYPRGNKVAGAYLKQGLSFAALGENANSRLILNELIKKFPNSGEAVIGQKKLKKIK
jgi:tol-pal system protein YbgF